MAARRRHLAERRRALGYSQESFAEQLGTDRTTVSRWERGECEPYPFIRPKLGALLRVTPTQLDTLLKVGAAGEPSHSSRQPAPVVADVVEPEPDPAAGELDDVNRRELLRLLSIAGTLVALPEIDAQKASAGLRPAEPADLDQYQQLNVRLWQVFALSKSKRLVYPMVSEQLAQLITSLEQAHTQAAHRRLCLLLGDLFQLAGEVFFDSNRYTDAAYCYTLAASASKEAGGHDLWACALTRHAYVGMYERRYDQAASILAVASRVADLGDSQLSTRHWVAAVQAQAFASLGDLDSCDRALDAAQQVSALGEPVTNSGWLRFDGSRLAEERGTCYLTLGRTDRAETALTDALNQQVSLRRRGSILTDLAILGVQRRDLDQIVQHGHDAADLAEQTRSAGYLGRKLQTLHAQLRPLIADNRVAQLDRRITDLARTA